MPEKKPLYNNFAPLRNVAALVALIDRLVNRDFNIPGMATFYGPSGYGKTYASVYAANKFQAVLVQCGSLTRPRHFCTQILHEIGVKPRGAVPDLVDQVAQNLAMLGVPLIVDEADHLIAQRMGELIRDIYDRSEVPVILIGEELLPQKMRQVERLHSRQLKWVGLEPADMHDLNELAPRYAPGIQIDEALKAQILRVAHGSLRRITVNLDAVRERARFLGRDRIGMAEMEVQSLFTGTAPAPRRSAA